MAPILLSMALQLLWNYKSREALQLTFTGLIPRGMMGLVVLAHLEFQGCLTLLYVLYVVVEKQDGVYMKATSVYVYVQRDGSTSSCVLYPHRESSLLPVIGAQEKVSRNRCC